MVNQEPTLQRLILDVFEEQEDSFYFPLRSQKDARAFVKAIHMKGASYEQMYETIGEFEHNFSCWRNGLGRPGIGNRIMDMINQPLVDLLEEEDMFPMNGSHTNGAQREQRSWEDNNRVPPTPHSNAQKKAVMTSQPAKKSVDQTDSGPKATNTTSNNRNTMLSSSKPEPVVSAAPEPAKQSSPLLARSELRKVEKDEKPAAPKEQKEEAPKRMVELRRTPPRQESKDRPVSELEKMKQQILNNKQEEQKQERRSSSGSSSSESESGSSSSSSSSSSDSETKVEKVLGKFDAIKITDSPVEETPPKKPERLFVDEQKKEEKKEEKKEVAVKKEEVTKKETVAKKLSAHEERREEMQKEDQRLEEQKREERKEQLKRLKEKYQHTAPSGGGGIAPEEVDENYNSDLDPENTNQSPVMATLVKKISAMRTAGKNSSGFVYVFSDSAQGSAKVRVKVGSSRCPNKRLQQAKLFNPNMYLVATYPVSQRVSALNDIYASLSANKLEGSPDWFTGALDNIVKVVQNNTEKYPSKALDDATTGQSES